METIQDFIDRFESARDRCRNAGDEKGALDAEMALGDLRCLSPSSLAAAQEIENYFNKRAGARMTKAKGALDVPVEADQPPGARAALLGRTTSDIDTDDSSDDS